MTDQNREQLKDLMVQLGLERSWVDSFFKEFNFPEKEQEVQLIFQNILPEEIIRADLVFEKEQLKEDYKLTEYTAQLSIVPEKKHGTVDGIDTLALAELMDRLDWQFDYRVLEREYDRLPDVDKAVFKEYLRAIYNLIMLAATDEGKEIADALKLNHFRGTPYEERFLSPEVIDRHTRSATFYLSSIQPVTFSEARNLLSGRSVRKGLKRPNGNMTYTWIKTGKAGDPKAVVPFFVSSEQRFPDYDLLSSLKKLPLKGKDEATLSHLVSALQSGSIVSTALLIDGGAKYYFIEAAPQQKSVNLYDFEMKKVSAATLLKHSIRNKKRRL